MKYCTYQNGVYSSIYPESKMEDSVDIASFMFDYRPAERVHPEKDDFLWLIDSKSGREMRYSECRAATDRLTAALKAEYDIGVDDVVLLYSPNAFYYPMATWATFRLGGIVSGANPTYTASELLYQIKTVGHSYKIKCIIAHPDSLSIAKDACASAGISEKALLLIESSDTPNVRQTQSGTLTCEELMEKHKDAPLVQPYQMAQGNAKKKVAFLALSSGTTGLPKAVVISHYNVISNCLQMHGFRRPLVKPGSTRVLVTIPLYHIYGSVVGLHASIYSGASIVILQKFVFTDFLRVIEKYKIAILYLVPPMVILILKHPEGKKANLSSVEHVMVGAAPTTVDTLEACRQRFSGGLIGQGYGMTETSTVVTCIPSDAFDFPGGSCGVLIPNTQLKVVDPKGKLVGPGEIGELCFKSPSNTLGYLNNPKATRETFDEEGYVHTGDEGYVHKESGAIFITDRIKELIKTKGMQVAPAELEGLLLAHNDVEDVCVIGVKDAYSGELPRAYVVLTPSAKAAASDPSKAEEIKQSIAKHVESRAVKYKWLTGGVHFTDAIPKNPSGKLLRRILRDQANRETKL